MNKKNRKGFTIVELVIVIAVIGILATVLVPTFGNVIDNANQSAAVQEAKNAYTNYVAAVAGTGNVADDAVIAVKGGFVIVDNGAVVNELFEEEADALAALVKTCGKTATEGKTIEATKGTVADKVTPVTGYEEK